MELVWWRWFLTACDAAGPEFYFYDVKNDAKKAAKNVQSIHTSVLSGTITRNSHQDFIMGKLDGENLKFQSYYAAIFRWLRSFSASCKNFACHLSSCKHLSSNKFYWSWHFSYFVQHFLQQRFWEQFCSEKHVLCCRHCQRQYASSGLQNGIRWNKKVRNVKWSLT